MGTYWNGGDNPNIDYGKMAYIPEISFEVGSNDENEETVSRSAGMLKALAVALKPDGNSIIEGSGTALFATAHSGISQNVNRGLGLLKSEQDLKVQVGADLLQEDKDAKLLVRYWLGSDKSKAVVQEMSFSKSYKEEDSYGTENNYIVGNPLLYKIGRAHV